jgi:hypothetical protein
VAFELVDIVRRKRALEEDLAVEMKALKARFEPKIEVLEKYLMAYLIDNKLKTVATEAGTVMTYKRRKIKLNNFAELEAWAEFNNRPEFIKHDVDSTEVLAYLDAVDGRLLPDGLVMDSTNVLSVKAPK